MSRILDDLVSKPESIYIDVGASHVVLSLENFRFLVGAALSHQDDVFESIAVQLNDIEILKQEEGYEA